MKYLLAQNQRDEIPARRDYLQDVFGLIYLPKKEVDGFIPLVPLGTAEPSVLFMIGHYDQVTYYLEKHSHEINEKIVILITCCVNKIKKYKKKNAIWFASVANNGLSYCYDGRKYGFDFDITKSELDFYNSKESDIIKRLEKVFDHL